tara:strand:+ start:774 stop:1100 length:327 start_codon:yes stop_codon:yes gene_type:complete
MKKLLLILMLLPLLSMGQMSKEELPDNLYSVNLQLLQKPNKQKDVHSGYALMLGGGMFTLLGLATPNEGEIVNGKYQQRPLYKQPAHLLAVLTGASLLFVGITITIGQ